MSIHYGKNGDIKEISSPLDVERIRQDFPILSRTVHPGKPLVYLDNAATSQKPQIVIDKLSAYYRHSNANVHRGIHVLSEEATDAYEGARRKIQQYIHAESEQQVIFTKGATESVNLVANAWGRKFLEPGDEILVSYMEHHSNIVPWHLIARDTGVTIRGIEITDSGHLDLEQFRSVLSEKTKLVAVTQMSNVLGTLNPIQEISMLAHQAGAKVLVDGAQGAAHMPSDVQKMDCDFYV
ncbi:MAG TPA: aminotransferase class V-fold PLP-dependent enzyme, partial [bacterium]|nr:aminotransferase class V-fold PLP-dependent enzyme [bacterium]